MSALCARGNWNGAHFRTSGSEGACAAWGALLRPGYAEKLRGDLLWGDCCSIKSISRGYVILVPTTNFLSVRKCKKSDLARRLVCPSASLFFQSVDRLFLYREAVDYASREGSQSREIGDCVKVCALVPKFHLADTKGDLSARFWTNIPPGVIAYTVPPGVSERSGTQAPERPPTGILRGLLIS